MGIVSALVLYNITISSYNQIEPCYQEFNEASVLAS